MSNKKKEKKMEPINFVLAKEWFENNNLPWSGKRATVFAIYYSFPSNQNAGGSTGTNVIVQKVIPWGNNAEPRVYISPYALKRRIRDYWIKKGEKVYMREDKGLIDKDQKLDLSFIDIDLFGYMKAGKGSSSPADVRPGPITTWGAIGLETLHSFVDFNTSILSTTESEKGGSIINRNISKEFYFTTFYINPDLICVDVRSGKEERALGASKEEISKNKEDRLKLFFEALSYAMQKDSGGARDRPACALIGIQIGDCGYPDADKKIFRSIEIKNDKIIKMELTENFKVLEYDPSYFDSEVQKVIETKKIGLENAIKNLLT